MRGGVAADTLFKSSEKNRLSVFVSVESWGSACRAPHACRIAGEKL